MTIATTRFAVATLVAIVCSGCGGGQESGGSPATTATKAPSGRPVAGRDGAKVRIVAPVHDGAVSGDTFTVQLEVEGAKLGPRRKGGPDFVMLQLDDGRYDLPKWSDSERHERALGLAEQVLITPDGSAERTFDSGEYSVTSGTELTYRDIPKGTHRLEALLIRDGSSWTHAEHEIEFEVD